MRSRRKAFNHLTRHAGPESVKDARDWRCAGCGRLLGRRQEQGVRLVFARGEDYLASTPISASCRRCGTLNQLPR